MKKKLFYLLSIVMLGTGLSSCLDNASNASMSGSEFAVIKRFDNISYPVACTQRGLFLTWDGISQYGIGDAMILTYDVDLNNQSNGVVIADPTMLQVADAYPSASQIPVVVGPVDTLVQNTDNMFESLAMRAYLPNRFLDDKWLFMAKASKKDGQTINLRFNYDASAGMQHTSTGAPLPENVAVVDVQLVISGEGDGTATSQEEYFVVNFSNLRNEVFKNATEGAQSQIWLRFYDKTKSGTRPSYLQNVGTLVYDTTTPS